jgi:hypothetical protein
MRIRIPRWALVVAVAAALAACSGQSTGSASQSDDTGAGTAEAFTAAAALCNATHGNGLGLNCDWTAQVPTGLPGKPSFADIEVFAQGGFVCVAGNTGEHDVGLSCNFAQPGAQGLATKPSFAEVAFIIRQGRPCVALDTDKDSALDCATAAETKAAQASATGDSPSPTDPAGGSTPRWKPSPLPTSSPTSS